jgi:hypothetical protein
MVCVVLEFCNEHAEALLAAPGNTRQLPSIKQIVQPNSEGAASIIGGSQGTAGMCPLVAYCRNSLQAALGTSPVQPFSAKSPSIIVGGLGGRDSLVAQDACGRA